MPGIELMENNIDVFAIYALGIMGVILSTFFTNNNSDYGTVIGNSVIVITSVILIFMILYVYKFNNTDRDKVKESNNSIETILGTINNISINTIIKQGLPILLLIVALVYVTILNIMYRDKHILPGYTLYNSIFQYIVIIQLLLIYKTAWTIIIDNTIEETDKINIQQLFTIIVGVINLAIATIIHIILKSYSVTDE